MNKNGKGYLTFFLLFCMMYLMSGCAGEEIFFQIPETVCQEGEIRAEGRGIQSENGSGETPEQDEEDTQEEEGSSSSEEGLPEEECFLMEQAGHFAYDSLSEAEQIWYLDIADILGSMKVDERLSEEGLKAGLDETCIDTVFQCVMNDHPELFYVEGYYYSKYTRGDNIVAVSFSGNYNQEKEEVRSRQAEIQTSADEMISRIPEDASEYDRVKFVYETLIRETEYDMYSADNQNIYSVFVNHRSVCQGYAKATQYLLLRLGMECTLVQGTVDTGESHAWNLVRVDNEYYYVDTTWGDASYRMSGEQEGNGDQAINYDYLCVNTKQLLRTHTLGGCVPMPECTAWEANYYVREDALFDAYDRERMTALFERAAQEGRTEVTVKCADNGSFQDIKRILIGEQEIFDYIKDSGEEITYASNESQLSLTFWLR